MNSLYNKKLKFLARKLRNNSTFGEVILWSKVLRAKQMLGYQFNRQFAMKIPSLQKGEAELNIIVDFICRKLKLIIEIDGYSHDFKYKEDKIRDKKLLNCDYCVLRFTEHEVKYDLENVIRTIENRIHELEQSIPLAPFKKGE
jgi:very-short-patch-repair endonuclease